MNYKVTFHISYGGSLEVTVNAENDHEARRLVKTKFADLCQEIVYSIELPTPLAEKDQNNLSNDNLIIQL